MPVNSNFSRSLQANVILLATVVIVTTMIISYRVSVIHSKYKGDIEVPEVGHGGDYNVKVILYWDRVLGERAMDLGIGSKIFEQCEISNCYITNSRKYMPEDRYDAIIFHGDSWKNGINGAPAVRSPSQRYIFFSWESPYESEYDAAFFRANKNFFNWTMGYRSNSDIYFPYGIVRKKPTNYIPPTLQKVADRPKMFAWIENKCDNIGSEKAIEFVQALERHFEVDVFGDCGTKTCTDCFKLIEETYLFYLSFEYAQCDDFVTRRLYEPLRHDVVPIVFGKANYDRFAPPGSVINIDSFKSTDDFLRYLGKLSNNSALYMKYFEWKKNYVVHDPRPAVLCRLCDMLHKPVEHTSYEDMKSWLTDGNQCENYELPK